MFTTRIDTFFGALISSCATFEDLDLIAIIIIYTYKIPIIIIVTFV